MVVGDFHEDGGGKPDVLAGRDDESWLLDEFHMLPLGVARDRLVKPLVHDCRAVRVSGWHEREFEEGCGTSVEHLNVLRIDLLELLDQCCVVV